MEVADYELGVAHVQVDEWVGTVAAENDITTFADELYDVVDLDRSMWSILAVDFYDGTSRSRSEVNVYAIDRVEHGLTGLSYEKLMVLAGDRGSLPVTNFKVHGVEAEQIIKRVFKRYAVRLRSRTVKDIVLHVEKLDDLKMVD